MTGHLSLLVASVQPRINKETALAYLILKCEYPTFIDTLN